MSTFEFDLAFAHGEAWANVQGGGGVQWQLTDAVARLPRSLDVSGCQVLEATVSDDAVTGPLELRVMIRAKAKSARFEMAHGEWLYAAEGRVGQGTAAIGTHDAEWLAANKLPAAMLAADVLDGYARLSVTVPQAVVMRGTRFAFAIAWVDDWAGKADLEVAPWLALSHALALPDVPEGRT